MFFNKAKCRKCSSNVEDKFSFCPYCGSNLTSKEKEKKDFGMLGKNDIIENIPLNNAMPFEGMISSLANTIFKQLTENMRNNTEIQEFPNGIAIRVGVPVQKQKPQKPKRNELTEEQIGKISKLPRAEAKTKIVRLSDKIIYELSTPGIESIQDILVSKLESGYEIKSICPKKIYTSTIPISLELKRISIDSNKTFIEFKA
jgi:hypothetical protein